MPRVFAGIVFEGHPASSSKVRRPDSDINCKFANLHDLLSEARIHEMGTAFEITRATTAICAASLDITPYQDPFGFPNAFTVFCHARIRLTGGFQFAIVVCRPTPESTIISLSNGFPIRLQNPVDLGLEQVL